jgi:hypothetical protein
VLIISANPFMQMVYGIRFFKDIQKCENIIPYHGLNDNYQVISQIRSTDNLAIASASFNVIVPLRPFGKFNFDSLPASSLFVPVGLVASHRSLCISNCTYFIIKIRTKSENTTL